MSQHGTLYLVPVPVSDESGLRHIPSFTIEVLKPIEHFIVENEKTARKHLKLFGYGDLQKARLSVLNEHSKESEVAALIKPLTEGHDVALMSEAGCPAVADPGSSIVNLCHRYKIPVRALSGPSSVLMAVMTSGFTGQNFAFCGYLPVDRLQRTRRLKELEQAAVRTGQAQFFIETPYRNDQLVQAALTCLQASTRFYIGRHLGGDDELTLSLTVAQWKSSGVPPLHKQPAIFGIFG